MRKSLFLPLIALLIAACQSPQKSTMTLSYPPTAKTAQADIYFGVEVGDPYRWLENDTAPETEAWVKAQNEITFSYLDKIPFRKDLRARLEELYNYPRVSAPFRKGEHYFFYKNSGLQNQSVIYVQKGLEGEPEVLIDPNTLSAAGTTAVALIGFSEDKRYAAYSKQEAGSDWQKIYVLDLQTRQTLTDELSWVKFTGAEWYGQGFFYARFPAPAPGSELSAESKFQKIYYHRLGTAQSEDILIYEDLQRPNMYHNLSLTEDKQYMILTKSTGTDGFETWWKKTDLNAGGFKPLFTGFEHKNTVIDHVGGAFLVHTDIGAPRYRLVQVDPARNSEQEWKTIIPEREEVLEGVSTAGGKLYASYLKNAYSQIVEYAYDGSGAKPIELPAIGTASFAGAEKEDTLTFYTFTSFTYPATVFSYNLRTGESKPFFRPEVKFDPDAYETKQVFYPSKDGTQVSMFLVHKKGLVLDGKNPAYLYGYGGFNISLTPGFTSGRIPLLERGVVIAIANLRGGGEYGEAWHQAGMLFKKQNVFDDFIAAAEYLIREKYTSSEKLAIAGGSNGGLLVGACMTQRPDLFRVALPAVGVMDMLRFHKFTVGWGWIPEYGCADSSEADFKNLYAYSPLHNLKVGVAYPSTLVTTADHDDRVVPAHSFKFAAALQEVHSGPNPVLIRIETQAGHGGGKPISKVIEELADVYSFMLWELGER